MNIHRHLTVLILVKTAKDLIVGGTILTTISHSYMKLGTTSAIHPRPHRSFHRQLPSFSAPVNATNCNAISIISDSKIIFIHIVIID